MMLDIFLKKRKKRF